MKKLILLLVFVFSLSACTGENSSLFDSGTKSPIEITEEVIDDPEFILNYSDFDFVADYATALSQAEELYLLYFYSEQCSHCINLKEEALTFFEDNSTSIKVYLLDAGNTIGNYKSIDLGNDETLIGTPTLILVKDGVVYEYFVGTYEIAEFFTEYAAETYLID